MDRPAILWDTLEDQRVRCRVCPRRCLIPPGERGFCLTRENRDGTFYTLIYGAVSSLRVAPVEAKPLFHFYPASRWLSLGSLGCNCRCPGCQNWQIAHARPGGGTERLRDISPEQAVDMAADQPCKGLSWTYNEPTMWLEYTIDAGRLARERGLMANYVTNGYITPEALDAVAPHLDAWRVDVKAFTQDAYRALANVPDFQPILEAAARAKTTHGLHVECVTNVVPGHNDDEAQLTALADWIVDALGCDTPWHVTRFVPHLDMADVPATPVETLNRAHQIGLDRGLQYVYIGNVPGHEAENTSCHACGALLIERDGRSVRENRMLGRMCPFCGVEIPGVFPPYDRG